MKILHTADIHLKKDHQERWEALCSITETGREEKIDLLIICGDLFDADVEAPGLKNDIRPLFSGLDYNIVILPGNHDSRSFEDGGYLGPNVKIILSSDEFYEIGDICIAGLPFEETKGREIYGKLKYMSDRLPPEKCCVLLYHGELLDSFYSRNDFGDEGEGRYMPSKLDYFRDLNFDYVLAGHFHTNFNVWEFSEKRYFVYPGSPVSITTRETGRRKANLFTAGEPPLELPLSTPYFNDLIITLDPFSDIDPVSIIRSEIDRADKNAAILLSVEGFINREKHGIDETALKESIEMIKKEKGNITEKRFAPIDWSRILEDDIFKAFIEKLKLKEYDDEQKNTIRNFFMKAMQYSEI